MLDLAKVEHPHIRGIYGSTGDILPERMRFLHPLAAEAFCKLLDDHGDIIAVSDMWRSSSASLRRSRRSGAGALAPGYSAHNYGLAIDIDVSYALKRAKFKHKTSIDTLMSHYGWFCHRCDGVRGSEEWHYNFLGEGTKIPDRVGRTSNLVEAKIQGLYGENFECSFETKRKYLRICGYISAEFPFANLQEFSTAVKLFQRDYNLVKDGVCGPRTTRTLFFRAAEISTKELITFLG